MVTDDTLVDTLRVLADDVRTHTGFHAVAVSVRCSDTELRTVACAGDDRVRDRLQGAVMPLSAVHALLEGAQLWGNLHFVADATSARDATEGHWSWIDEAPFLSLGDNSAVEVWWTQEPWERENALLAPLMGEDGSILGLISVDLPVSGRRPDEAQRVALSVYARHGERSIAAALARTSETRHLDLAHAARLIVREAGIQHHITELLPRARTTLMANFDLRHVWIKSTSPEASFGEDPTSDGPVMAPTAGEAEALPAHLVTALTRTAQICWDDQLVVEVSAHSTQIEGMDPTEVGDFVGFLAHHHISTALLVPLGSGSTRLGSMILGRSQDGRAWSDAEKMIILDIAHDIGRAMVHTLWFGSQERATLELRQHAEYKRALLMTMSHELQTPLASIRAHVELISPDLAHDVTVARSLVAIERGSDRLTKLVNNMIWLARVDDPHRPVDVEPVDFAEAVRLVVEDATFPEHIRWHSQASATARAGSGRDVHFTMPDKPLWVSGTQSELILATCNVIANALKYTDDGGQIHVSLTESNGTVELAVADDGIGVTAAETQLIFEDFYRSTAPAVRQRPGTGLGLGIVSRIVARHHGDLALDNTTPERTVFQMRFPAHRH